MTATTAVDKAATDLGLHISSCPVCKTEGRRCLVALRLRAVAQAAQDARGAGVQE